jgi:hypothetical protein
MIKKTIAEELKRFNSINRYTETLMTEQNVPAPMPNDPAADPTAEEDPTMGADPTAAPDPTMGADPTATPGPTLGSDTTPVDDDPTASLDDPSTDVSPEADDTTEEMDITDLVNMTKDIKKQLDATKDDGAGSGQKMDNIFSKLSELEVKLGEMDTVLAKIDQLGSEVRQMKPKSPQEKLEMRSLDSYPFNEKPNDFFAHKQEEMRAAGKNEYVLTKDDVQNYGRDQMLNSFNTQGENQKF